MKSSTTLTMARPDIESGPWSEAAVTLLEERYLLKKDDGTQESIEDRFWSVAQTIAKVGERYGETEETVQYWAEQFYSMMVTRKFMPNSPTIMNVGKNNGLQNSACFVLEINDSLESIFNTMRDAALIHQSGGGCIGSNSMVLTEKGPVQIKKLVEEKYSSQVLSYNSESKKTEYHSIGQYHTNPLPAQRIYNVELMGGSKVTASDWHPFFVWNGKDVIEVRADELKKGDVVIGSSYWNGSNSNVDELSWFVGAYLSDGYIDDTKNGTRIRFVKGNEEFINRVASVLECNPHLSYDQRYQSDVWEISKTGKAVERMIAETGIEKSVAKTKHFPEQVWSWTVNNKLSLLVGLLDGDGWYEPEKNRLCYGTTSKILHDEVLALCGYLGLYTTTRTRISSKDNESPFHEVRIEISLDMAELINKYSVRYSVDTNPQFRKSIPLSQSWKDDLKIQSKTSWWRLGMPLGDIRLNYQRWTQHGKANLQHVMVLLKELGHTDLAASLRGARTVQSVHVSKENETLYDLTVPTTQTYIAGESGYVVVHNTGFSFGRLRSRGSQVKTTKGVSSGPVSFLRVYDSATESVKQGGTRRGANMAILPVHHPDIFEFIDCKLDGGITNFNISVAATDEFMERVKRKDETPTFELVDPHSKAVTFVNAMDIWRAIINAAYSSGDPGLMFIDVVNQSAANPLFPYEVIESTNPCGEESLPPNDVCNLLSINLSQFVKDDQVDWEGLKPVIVAGVRFLDSIIDDNPVPVQAVIEQMQATRRIGLGVMGWHDMLLLLGLPYDSFAAFKLAEDIMKFIKEVSYKADQELAESRGAFPKWHLSKFANEMPPMRNNTITMVAPTGSISIIAGCSSGIEPMYALTYKHRAPAQKERVLTIEYDSVREALYREDSFPERALEAVISKGSLKDYYDANVAMANLFAIAPEIRWEAHILMQAAWQKHCDNGISKTINMPNSATKEEVEQAYLMAYDTGCRGTTIFRDGSKGYENQVLHAPTQGQVKEEFDPLTFDENDNSFIIGPNQQRQAHVFTIEAPEGKAHITITFDKYGKPRESFINVGRAGSDVAATSETIGRLVSLNLSDGISAEKIIHQLQGINGSSSVGFGPNRVTSLADAVAKAIKQYIEYAHVTEPTKEDLETIVSWGRNTIVGDSGATLEEYTALATKKNGNVCPTCQSYSLYESEGCVKCKDCGWSKC